MIVFQEIEIAKNYLNEDWLFNLIDKCKTIAWQHKESEPSGIEFKKINNSLKLLPIEFACDYDKKPESLRKIGVIDLLYLVIKNHTTGKIKVEIDKWNIQSQRVAERLGFNLIHNSLIINNL